MIVSVKHTKYNALVEIRWQPCVASLHAVRDDKTEEFPTGNSRACDSYEVWNLDDFICLERHLEARGISVQDI